MLGEDTTGSYHRRWLLRAIGAGMMVGSAGCVTDLIGKQAATNTILYGDRDDSVELYAGRYNKSTNQATVDFTLTDGRYRDTITKVKAGANIHPLLGLDIARFAYFNELEVLSDITGFYESLPYTDDFLGDVGTLFTTSDGRKFGVPYWIDSSLYFYNKRHFEQAGLDPENPPETWTAFRAALETLDSELDLDRPPLGAAFTTGLVGFFGYPYIWSNGGRVVNDAGTKALFDRTPSVEALQFWVDINNAGLMTDPLATNWTDWHNMFANGKISMMFTGGLGLGTIQDSNSELFENDLGTALFPKPEGGTRTSYLGGNTLTITTSVPDDKRRAALDFLQWVNSEEGMQTTLDIGFMPGRARGFETGLATQEPYDSLLDAYRDTLKRGNTPIYPDYEEVDLIITAAWSKALSGSASPKRALSNAAREANEVLDE